MQESVLYEEIKKSGLGVVFPFMGQPTVAATLLARDLLKLKGAIRTKAGTKQAAKGVALSGARSPARDPRKAIASRGLREGAVPRDEGKKNQRSKHNCLKVMYI